MAMWNMLTQADSLSPLWLSIIFMLWFFSPSQPLKPSWDQQVQNWSSYLKSTGFYQTEVEFLGNINNIGQMTHGQTFPQCQETVVAQCPQISLCPVEYMFYTDHKHTSVVSAMCFSPGMSILPVALCFCHCCTFTDARYLLSEQLIVSWVQELHDNEKCPVIHNSQTIKCPL